MDPLISSLLSGLAGAIIGAGTSVATLLIQNHYQSKREMQKLAIQVAIDEYRARIKGDFGKIGPVAGPILVAYYTKLINLAKKDKLTKENMHWLFKSQTELARAYWEAYTEFIDKPKRDKSAGTKSSADD